MTSNVKNEVEQRYTEWWMLWRSLVHYAVNDVARTSIQCGR